MKKLFLMLSMIAVLCFSCKEEEPLTLSLQGGETINAPKEGTSASFKVLSNTAWTVSSNAAWCKVNGQQTVNGSGDLVISVTVDANTAYANRDAKISVSAQGISQTYTVQVNQLGIQPTFSVTEPTGLLQAGGSFTMVITANVPWTIEKDAAATWCTVAPMAGANAATITVSADANANPASRTATLTFKPEQNLTPVTKSVIQMGEAPEMVLSPASLTVSGAASTFSVQVSSNLTYQVTPTVGWLTVASGPAIAPQTVVTKTVTFSCSANTTTASRPGTIDFTSGTFVKVFNVQQNSVQVEAAADSMALVKLFKKSNAIAAWDALVKWDTTKAISTWPGVVLDENKRVIKLTIPNATTSWVDLTFTYFPVLSNLQYLSINAKGTTFPMDSICLNTSLKGLNIVVASSTVKLTNGLPDAIANLVNLERLTITGNYVAVMNKKTMPAAIGQLTKLKYVNFNYADFGGVIPTEIKNLTVLDTLLLNNSSYSDFGTGIGQLGNLKYLSMNANSATCTLPASLAGLTSLVKLELGNSKLSGTIPTGLENASNLTDIILYTNPGLTGAVPAAWSNLTNLKTLNMYSCTGLTGGIAFLSGMSKLETVSLSGNTNMGGTIPTLSTTVTNINFENMGLTGEIPASLGNLTNLTNLQLKTNKLTGAIPAELGALSKVTNLTLAANQFTSIQSGFSTIGTAGLTSLDFSGNQITSIPADIARKATMLNFGTNKLTPAGFPAAFTPVGTNSLNFNLASNPLGSIPTSISTLTNLSMLMAGNCNLTSISASSMPTSIVTLNLQNNSSTVTPTDSNKIAVITLSDLPNLATLNLIGCKVSSLSLTNLPKIASLDMTRNQLTSVSLSDMSGLTSLVLADNKLTSVDLTGLVKLTGTLNVSNNQLTNFTLPASSAASITSLNLSGNLFTTLTNLPDMPAVTFLNLANNRQLTSVTIPKMAMVTNIDLSCSSVTPGTLTTVTFPAAADLPKITTISLQYNKLTAVPVGIFNYGATLATLNLQFNNILTFPQTFENLYTLRTINMEGNKITDLPNIFRSSAGNASNLGLWPNYGFNMKNNKLTDGGLPTSLTTPAQTYYSKNNFCPQDGTTLTICN